MSVAPRISIAMATYNGARYLAEQLASFGRQTVLPFELVVTDDGSSDGTVDIISHFSRTAPFPVRLFRNEKNLGFADNFLKAASLCQGDWIAFSDQDDVWMDQKLARLSEVATKFADRDIAVIGHSSLIVDKDLNRTGQRLPWFERDEVLPRAGHFGFFCIVGFSLCCHASLIRDYDPALRPTRYREAEWTPPGHDQWLSMLGNIVGNIAVISEPLALWRRHGDSLTRPPSQESLRSEAATALTAVSPDVYFLRSRMAGEASETFAALASRAHEQAVRDRLADGAVQFAKLSTALRLRGELYSAPGVRARWATFLRMLSRNAYFSRPVCALGMRPFLKDLSFCAGAFGMLRRILA